MAINPVLLPINGNVYMPNPLTGVQAAQMGAETAKMIGNPFSSLVEGYYQGRDANRKYEIAKLEATTAQQNTILRQAELEQRKKQEAEQASFNREKFTQQSEIDKKRLVLQEKYYDILGKKANNELDNGISAGEQRLKAENFNKAFYSSLSEAGAGNPEPLISFFDGADKGEIAAYLGGLNKEQRALAINKLMEARDSGTINVEMANKANRIIQTNFDLGGIDNNDVNKATQTLKKYLPDVQAPIDLVGKELDFKPIEGKASKYILTVKGYGASQKKFKFDEKEIEANLLTDPSGSNFNKDRDEIERAIVTMSTYSNSIDKFNQNRGKETFSTFNSRLAIEAEEQPVKENLQILKQQNRQPLPPPTSYNQKLKTDPSTIIGTPGDPPKNLVKKQNKPNADANDIISKTRALLTGQK